MTERPPNPQPDPAGATGDPPPEAPTQPVSPEAVSPEPEPAANPTGVASVPVAPPTPPAAPPPAEPTAPVQPPAPAQPVATVYGTAASAPAHASAPAPGSTPTPAPRRRFPWVPILAGVAVLQLLGAGVLVALLIGAGTQVVNLNETVADQQRQLDQAAEREQQLQALHDDLDALTAERDAVYNQLASVEDQIDTLTNYLTVYEQCFEPLFGAYDAWYVDDVEGGDELFEQAWGQNGPCWHAELLIQRSER